jgi:hypothetical protein
MEAVKLKMSKINKKLIIIIILLFSKCGCAAGMVNETCRAYKTRKNWQLCSYVG